MAGVGWLTHGDDRPGFAPDRLRFVVRRAHPTQPRGDAVIITAPLRFHTVQSAPVQEFDSVQPTPSNRSFGIVFTAFFALAGAWSWWRGGTIYPWALALAALTLIVTLTVPGVLTPPNRAWMKLGEWLRRIVSPVVLGAIFYGVFTPVGFFMRMAGRDALRRRFEPAAQTYWIERDPPGPDPSGMPNQF